jgi:hypothetical protein
MESFGNYSTNSSTTNFTDKLDDDDGQILIGVVAFAPLIALEFLAAVISNSILLALVILACVHKLNNNINIYLFSLSITGLMGAFSLFCLFTLIVGRRWVLGGAMCILNWFLVNITNLLYLSLYLIISLDKYRVVRGNSRPSTKRAYVLSTIVWAVSVVSVLAGLWQVADGQLNPLDNEHFVCYQLTQETPRNAFVFRTIALIGFWVLSAIIIWVSFFMFLRILLELRNLKSIQRMKSKRTRANEIVGIDGRRDRPLYASGEEGTAKSLALIYFIYLFTISVSYAMGYANILRNYILSGKDHFDPNFQVYFTVLLMTLLFPTTNPVYLILSNKRLRSRVKGLFKCELNPYLGDSPARTAVAVREINNSLAKPKKNKVGFSLKIKRSQTRILPMAVE